MTTKIPVELSSTPGIVDGSNATAITIDSSENVGIGTTSPSYPFHVTGSGDTVAAVTAGASSIAALNLGNDTNKADGGIRYDNSADALIFRASNAEKMRIDSSGNLLVSGTSSSINAGSISLEAQGRIRAGRDGGAVMQLNRTTSDGDIAVFYKDGSTVGSIGARSGDLTIGTGNCGLIFNDGTEIIIPANITTNAVSDANVDLGYSSGRFKDLYLSGAAKTVGADFSGQVQHLAGNVSTYFRADNARYGQIFMDNNAFNIKGWTDSGEPIKINAAASGGPILLQSASTTKVRIDGDGLKFNSDTAAANALDDYEEGTWTPGLAFGGGTTGLTYVRQQGKYIKIGSLVYIQGHLLLSNKGTSTGQASVTGIPFPPSSTSSGTFSPLGDRGNLNTGGRGVSAYLQASSTSFLLYDGGFDGSVNASTVDGDFNNSTEIDVNFVYYTNS